VRYLTLNPSKEFENKPLVSIFPVWHSGCTTDFT